ncbi:hypothetical protein [Mycobacterium tuberculosis]|uniref:hypothetical protein n=1 Tax=Mycobacterium tuberculosis TaxID=1773 RepID=UPI00272D38BB|nr:hypothetical protein [Mycobacterium tuberculosis]
MFSKFQDEGLISVQQKHIRIIDIPRLKHGDEGFNVDHVICPEQSVTNHIERLIEFPDALQVLDFADGK